MKIACTVGLATSVLLSACATTPPPPPFTAASPAPTGPRYRPTARLEVHVSPQLPTIELLYHPLIVPGVRMQNALGVEPAPDNGQAFIVEADSAPAKTTDTTGVASVQTRYGDTLQTGDGTPVQTGNGAAAQGAGGGTGSLGDVATGALNFVGNCVVHLGYVCPVAIVALPVMVPFALAGMSAHERVKRYRYEKRLGPSLHIPESEEARVAALLKGRPTPMELADHTAALLATDEFTGAPWQDGSIIVHVQSVEFQHARRTWVTMRVIAQAQAISERASASSVSQHIVEWHYGPLWQWTIEDNAAVEQGIAESLAALAKSIVSTYVH